MPSALYQKYRSSDFEEIRGQEHITKLLKNAVKSGQIAHAYLFVGSRGTGKTSTARILAKAVNCQNLKKDGNPCNECSNCIGISEGRFLDLVEIDAASNRGIDQIRELKEKIEFSPTDGVFKVYIIDEVHMLTTEAFNALLKTLEEPPGHIIFILATTDVHKLPPTILSRCQRYDFRLATDHEIKELLKDVSSKEKIKIGEKALDLVVQNAKGSYRDALSLFDVVYSGQENDRSEITAEEVSKVLGIPDIDSVIILLENLLLGNGVKSLEVVKKLEEKGTNLQQYTSFVLDILREILAGKITGDLDKKYSFAKDSDVKSVYKLINLFLETENKIRYASNQALVLELIIPEMMRPQEIKDIEMVNKDVKKLISKPEKKKEEIVDVVEVVGDPTCKDISVDEIRGKWETFVNEIKPFNGHLYAFLGGANIVKFEKGVLYIEVPFQFHKERMEIPKSRNAISETFKNVYGTGCNISCVVNSSIKPKQKSDAEFVLRNLPVIKPKEEKKDSKKESKKDIDAIFEGM